MDEGTHIHYQFGIDPEDAIAADAALLRRW